MVPSAAPQRQVVPRPTWDSTAAAVTLFNNLMPEHAIQTNPAFSMLIERATATNSRGRTYVLDVPHGYALAHGLYTLGTWKSPASTTAPTNPTITAACAC